MAECPDCGSGLQLSRLALAVVDHARSEGQHRKLKCNDCRTLFEPEEIH